MRIETLWQGERRQARLHWWRQVLDRPSALNGDDMFDEVLVQRFWLGPEGDGLRIEGVQQSLGLSF